MLQEVGQRGRKRTHHHDVHELLVGADLVERDADNGSLSKLGQCLDERGLASAGGL
jgi:hypothetical protein